VQIGGLAWWTRICGDFATKNSGSITNYMLSNFQGAELNRGLGKMGYVFLPAQQVHCKSGNGIVGKLGSWSLGLKCHPFSRAKTERGGSNHGFSLKVL